MNKAKDGTQIIASTHSIELLRDLLEAARGMGMLDRVRIIRMRNCGIVDVWDSERAYADVSELGVDLRII